MSLDLHLLRTFCVVAEEENLSRAATRLYLSPPAVSAHIKALEDDLGVRLFSRSSRGMSLTEAGHKLWDDAEALLKNAAELRRKAHALNEDIGGTLRIGINNPPETLHLDEILSALTEQAPTLRFECTFGASQVILSGLRGDDFDIGFYEGQPAATDLESVFLEDRELVLIAPHAWGSILEQAPVARLQEYPWIFASEGCSYYQFAREWQLTHNIQLDARIRSVDDDMSYMGFVARGLGLSIVSRQMLMASKHRDEIVILPQLSGSVPLQLGYLKSRESDALVHAGVSAVQAVWRANKNAFSATVSET